MQNCEMTALGAVVRDLTLGLQTELVTYKQRADAHVKEPYAMIKIAGHSIDQTPMPYEMWNFWKKNALDLPNWAEVADNLALIATSSADAERGFSIYDGCVNDQQKSSKEDKSESEDKTKRDK